MPERIQRQRKAGWRMPPNTRYVGRPSRFGNPFQVVRAASRKGDPKDMWAVTWAGQKLGRFDDRRDALEDAVYRFRKAIVEQRSRTVHAPTLKEIRDELSGKNIACWCKVGDPCHGDVLLELARSRYEENPR